MTQTSLTDTQINEGLQLLNRLARAEVPMLGAAWVKESESGDWYIYIVTPLVDPDGATRPAYQRINGVLRDMVNEGFQVDPFAKKVFSPQSPIGKDIIANCERDSGKFLLSLPSGLGGLDVAEVYVYPISYFSGKQN